MTATMLNETLESLLQASQAEPEFKRAVLDFADSRDSHLIKYTHAPRIKVLRVVMKLLDAFPEAQIARVELDGLSSCSSYTGQIQVDPGNVVIRFRWDCYWKAQEEGFKTWYDQPDQTKAAQVFGYQCFQYFDVVQT